jgi:hypothetical protein
MLSARLKARVNARRAAGQKKRRLREPALREEKR